MNFYKSKDRTITVDGKKYALTPDAGFGDRVFHSCDGEECFYADDVELFLSILKKAFERNGTFTLCHRPDYDDADEDGIRFSFMPAHGIGHPVERAGEDEPEEEYWWFGGGGSLKATWMDFISDVFDDVFETGKLDRLEDEMRKIYKEHIVESE